MYKQFVVTPIAETVTDSYEWFSPDWVLAVWLRSFILANVLVGGRREYQDS